MFSRFPPGFNPEIQPEPWRPRPFDSPQPNPVAPSVTLTPETSLPPASHVGSPVPLNPPKLNSTWAAYQEIDRLKKVDTNKAALVLPSKKLLSETVFNERGQIFTDLVSVDFCEEEFVAEAENLARLKRSKAAAVLTAPQRRSPRNQQENQETLVFRQ